VEYTKEEFVPSLPPRYTSNMWEKTDDSPNAEGLIGDKLCLMTIDMGASVTIARPDNITGLSKKDLPSRCILQMASGDPLHLEENFHKTDSGAVPTNDLGVRHQYHT
jgi:hypothetical protein